MKLAGITLSSLTLILFVKYTFRYLYPFFCAILIAYLVHPVVSYITKRFKLPRPLATIVVISACSILVFASIFVLLTFLFIETTDIIEIIMDNEAKIIAYFTTVSDSLRDLYETLANRIPFLAKNQSLDIQAAFSMLSEFLLQASTSFFTTVFQLTGTLLSSLTYLAFIQLFIFLIVYFITKDIPRIHRFIHKNTPEKVKGKTKEFAFHFKKSVWAFVKAQIIITFISSVIICIGLLVMKVDHVFTLVMIVLVIDFIPYIGIGAVFIPWILFSFFATQYGLTIQLSILYAFVIIVRQIIEPKILASSMGIHPFIAISILFIGFQALGIIGILLTPLILMLLSALYHTRIIHILVDYVKQ